MSIAQGESRARYGHLQLTFGIIVDGVGVNAGMCGVKGQVQFGATLL